MQQLEIKNLRVAIGENEIIRDLSLSVGLGEMHAIMGPNGSGKSTLAKVIAGHPDYKVTSGEVLMDGENLFELEPDERARRGLFLAFQYPSEIPGVTIANFLRAAMQARLPEGEELEATDYYAKLYEKMDLLEIDRSFTSRAVNEGFSGGEKKRSEILQMAMLDPSYAVLDETDSGLDIDALKVVANGVNSLRGPNLGVLLITHYQRLLNYIVPDFVHVMVQGASCAVAERNWRWNWRKKATTGCATTRRSQWPRKLLIEMKTDTSAVNIDRDIGDFHYKVDYGYDAGVGLDERVVNYISDVKQDPDWVREFRLKALQTFESKPMPTHWASKDLEAIDFNKIRYYLAQGSSATRSWDEVPEDVKRTFERLGIPEQERKFLAGVEAQFDSEAVYSNIKKAVGEQGVIFVGSTEGLKEHPEIFRKWFGKVIPTGDNKFCALNTAVFSGGSFIYVPPGVKVKHPLQAYFRINAENFGQFERTLIICDEGSELTYMEGCTAPKFNTATLHSAVVELVALKGAKLQYITVQNWSPNVFNLVTKRGLAHEEAEIKWIDCNIGSRLTMKYPGVVMKGRKARGEVLSIALANDGQHQDTGAKMIHAADETTSNIISKSISIGTGRATYRGLVHVPKHLKNCKNNTECDALLINATAAPTPIRRSPSAAPATLCSTKRASSRSAPSRSFTCNSAA